MGGYTSSGNVAKPTVMQHLPSAPKTRNSKKQSETVRNSPKQSRNSPKQGRNSLRNRPKNGEKPVRNRPKIVGNRSKLLRQRLTKPRRSWDEIANARHGRRLVARPAPRRARVLPLQSSSRPHPHPRTTARPGPPGPPFRRPCFRNRRSASYYPPPNTLPLLDVYAGAWCSARVQIETTT